MKRTANLFLLLCCTVFVVAAQTPDPKEMEQRMKEMDAQMKAMDQQMKAMDQQMRSMESMRSIPEPPVPPAPPRFPNDTSRQRKVIVINGERLDLGDLDSLDIDLKGLEDLRFDGDSVDFGKDFRVYQTGDSVVVKVGGLKVKMDGDRNKHVIIKDDQDEDRDDRDGDDRNDGNKKKEKTVKFTSLGVRLGLNNYLYSGSFNLPAAYAPLELNTGKSINVNVGLAGIKWRIHHDYVTLHTGLALDFNNYRFGNSAFLVPNVDSVAFALPADNASMTKNKLAVTYIELPLRLQFATHKKESKAFRVAVGGRVAYRLGAHSKTIINDEKTKRRDDFNLNNVKYGATFMVGFSWLNLYVNYDFSPLFRDGVQPNLTPVSAGLVLANW